MAPFSRHSFVKIRVRRLQLLVKIARRAGDINSARNTALTVFDPLHDTGRFAALWAVGGLGRVHCFLTVAGFCNLGHGS